MSVIIVFGLIRFGASFNSSVAPKAVAASGGVAAEQNGGVQRITIGYSNRTGNYNPAVIKLKRGVPAELTLDPNTLNGCFSVFISRDLNLQGVAEPGNNVITFTPDKVGSFRFTCPMGMGRGTFIITD